MYVLVREHVCAEAHTPPHPVSYFLVNVKIGVKSLPGGNTKILIYMVKRCKFEKDLSGLNKPSSQVSLVDW